MLFSSNAIFAVSFNIPRAEAATPAPMLLLVRSTLANNHVICTSGYIPMTPLVSTFWVVSATCLPLSVLQATRHCMHVTLVQLFAFFHRMAASSDLLWRNLCTTKFNVPESASPDSWRNLYRYGSWKWEPLLQTAKAPCRPQCGRYMPDGWRGARPFVMRVQVTYCAGF